ncbi:MAG TPA: glycine cleavage T C-terminal barrel domain-containing protein [Candidatus Limnocylindrales bacterium]|nr:glycine cleavage T C-terminal barrel domain-containing protein [Candidatus Limnocylindrales bacterium]
MDAAAEVGEITSSVVSPEYGKVLALAIVRTAQSEAGTALESVAMDAAAPVAAGTKLSAGGAEVGEITSSVVSPEYGKVMALAIVRAAQSEAGTSWESAGGGTGTVLG